MKDEELFHQALEKPDDQRDSFLDAACEGDTDLRRRVDALLHAHNNPGSFLQSPAHAAPTIDQPITERPGTVIGRYKLLEQIGEGGFGVVFMAEQEEPVRRKVALKIIKPGMDTKEVIARFEAERQALAIMDHPNIAKVLDAGATESGRPYFVMELVRGIPITEFCDQNSLTAPERLELFVSVCQAVQHAHQKGIIHRDIKPSNVMVTLRDDTPMPKVIDFGVAKATNQRLTEKTLFTRFAQMVGTPLYMSPEQAGMSELDIDTRSDIYSLGVLLYELLTGTTPFDYERLREAAYDELLRIIREEEPPRPSLRISTLGDTLPSVAAHRKTEPRKLSSLFRGELDWIVMKALEKDRTRRYETATSFSADIERYLTDEPVQACPPSAAYRLKKFARRNKVAFSTSAVVVFAVVLGLAGTSWQAIRATRAADAERLAHEEAHLAQQAEAEQRIIAEQQRDRAIAAEEKAETEAAIAKAVNNFLNNDLLGMADAAEQVENKVSPAPDIKLLTLLDRAADTIDERFADQPLVEAAIRHTLGNAYRAIGQYQQAEKQDRQALELRQQALGTENLDTLASMNNLANTLLKQGRHEEAERLHRETLTIRQRVLGEEHPDTLESMNNLAWLLKAQGEYEECEKLNRETLEIRQRILGQEHADTLGSMSNLAGLLFSQGRYQEAEKLCRETRKIRQRVLGEEHPGTVESVNNLAVVLLGQARYQEAEELCRETLEMRQRILGPEHPFTLHTMMNLGNSLYGQSKHEEASILGRETLEMSQRILGPEHPHTLNSMSNLANSLEELGQHEEAETLRRETLEIRRRVLGPEHPDTLASMSNLANSLYAQGRNADAEELHRKTLEIRQRVLGAEHPDTLASMNNLAYALKARGDYEEYEKLNRETLETRQRVLGPEHPDTLASMSNLAASLEHLKRFEEAEALRRQKVETSERTLGEDHPGTARYRKELANFCGNWSWNLATAADASERDPVKALELAERAVEINPGSANQRDNLGVALYRTGNFLQAAEALEKAREMRGGKDPVHRFFLAMTYWELGRQGDAVHEYQQAEAWLNASKRSEAQYRFRDEARVLMERDDRQATVNEPAKDNAISQNE